MSYVVRVSIGSSLWVFPWPKMQRGTNLECGKVKLIGNTSVE